MHKHNGIDISIVSTWRDYFRNFDEGLGTTYERFILHRYFEMIRARFPVKTVLEVPSFGMTGVSGINSMWWALQGARVTIVDDTHERIAAMEGVWHKQSLEADIIHVTDYGILPFADSAFDMSWNFAALWFVHDLDTFVDELTRVTRHVIFICVPNKSGLGYLSRRLLAGTPSEGLQISNIHPRTIKETMAQRGWSVFEEGLFDVPPWPDIAMKKEDLLSKMGLKWVANRLSARSDGGMCILDYYSGKNKGMEQDVLKYDFLEAAPWILKKFWAHHWYALFTPSQR